MKEPTLVSIIINNYNYGRFITDAIASSLNQTYTNIEVIVVDDGSTDNSREIITSYGHKIVSIFQENGGQPSSYNSGFAISKGEIICFLDADDIFLPNKVERIIEVFQSQADIGWCFHSLQLINENCKPLDLTTTRNYVSRRCDFRRFIQSGRIPPSLPSSSALCFRRSLIEQILPMPTTEKMLATDFYVKYMAVGLSNGFILGEALTKQRIHGNNAITLQLKRQHVQAREQLFTSHWIRQKFPQFNNFANKLHAIGMFLNHKSHQSDIDNNDLIKAYFNSISHGEKIWIRFVYFYYFLKDCKSQFNITAKITKAKITNLSKFI